MIEIVITIEMNHVAKAFSRYRPTTTTQIVYEELWNNKFILFLIHVRDHFLPRKVNSNHEKWESHTKMEVVDGKESGWGS